MSMSAWPAGVPLCCGSRLSRLAAKNNLAPHFFPVAQKARAALDDVAPEHSDLVANRGAAAARVPAVVAELEFRLRIGIRALLPDGHYRLLRRLSRAFERRSFAPRHLLRPDRRQDNGRGIYPRRHRPGLSTLTLYRRHARDYRSDHSGTIDRRFSSARISRQPAGVAARQQPSQMKSDVPNPGVGAPYPR